MTYATLDTNGVLTVRPGLPDLEAIQSAVGGYFQVLNLANGAIMMLNEDGKFMDLPYNEFASELYAALGRSPLMPGDFIVGNVVFVGPPGPDDDGAETSLTDAMLDDLKGYSNEVVLAFSPAVAAADGDQSPA